MARRIRIVATIVAMALVASIMCIGIYAATQVSVNGSGTISMTAKDVAATVKGTQQYNSEAVTDLGTVEFALNGTEIEGTLNLKDTITFTSVNDTATIKLTAYAYDSRRGGLYRNGRRYGIHERCHKDYERDYGCSIYH